jgi:hypothetical protein
VDILDIVVDIVVRIVELLVLEIEVGLQIVVVH